MQNTLTFLRLGNYTEGTSQKGPWKKQEAIFETRDQYPHTICIIGWASMVETLQACKTGQAYDVKIDIESREFNGKWYTDVKCYDIAEHQTEQPQPAPAQPKRKAVQTTIGIVPPIIDDDPTADLPF